MALIYSTSATVTVAANTSALTIAGMDLAAVIPGMVIHLGARDRVAGDGYIVSSVTPNGSNGGTLQTVGAVPTAFNSAAFVIDSRDFNGTAPNYMIAMYTLVLNTLLKLTSPLTNLMSGSRTLALDKDSAGAVSRLLYAIGGRSWFGAEQRTLAYTPTGGVATSSETFALRAYPDGTTPVDSILIDGATGGVDVLVASSTMVAATTVDLGSAPTGKVTISNTGGGAVSVASFGTGKHKVREVHVQDAGVTLVNDAAKQILIGNANILLRAGDVFRITSDASGNWRMRSFDRADGKPLNLSDAVAKIGDTMTGALVAPTLAAFSPAGGYRVLGIDDNNRWFDYRRASDGAWNVANTIGGSSLDRFRVTGDGKIWASAYGNLESFFGRAVRLGSEGYLNVFSGNGGDVRLDGSNVVTGFNLTTGATTPKQLGAVFSRAVQQLGADGIWYNVAVAS